MSGQHAVLTGPIRADVTLADGTVVDVRPDVVYVDSPEQAAEVAFLIGEHYARRGHPMLDDDMVFVHEPTSVTQAHFDAKRSVE
jgi:hypothetical protein